MPFVSSRSRDGAPIVVAGSKRKSGSNGNRAAAAAANQSVIELSDDDDDDDGGNASDSSDLPDIARIASRRTGWNGPRAGAQANSRTAGRQRQNNDRSGSTTQEDSDDEGEATQQTGGGSSRNSQSQSQSQSTARGSQSTARKPDKKKRRIHQGSTTENSDSSSDEGTATVSTSTNTRAKPAQTATTATAARGSVGSLRRRTSTSSSIISTNGAGEMRGPPRANRAEVVVTSARKTRSSGHTGAVDLTRTDTSRPSSSTRSSANAKGKGRAISTTPDVAARNSKKGNTHNNGRPRERGFEGTLLDPNRRRDSFSDIELVVPASRSSAAAAAVVARAGASSSTAGAGGDVFQIPSSLHPLAKSTLFTGTAGGDAPTVQTTTVVKAVPKAWDAEDELACTICYEVMVSPVSLTCGHTFCDGCVLPWLDTHNKECPSCRDATKLDPVRNYLADAIIKKYLASVYTELEETGKPEEAAEARRAREVVEAEAEGRRVRAAAAKRAQEQARAAAAAAAAAAAGGHAAAGGLGGQGMGLFRQHQQNQRAQQQQQQALMQQLQQQGLMLQPQMQQAAAAAAAAPPRRRAGGRAARNAAAAAQPAIAAPAPAPAPAAPAPAAPAHHHFVNGRAVTQQIAQLVAQWGNVVEVVAPNRVTINQANLAAKAAELGMTPYEVSQMIFQP